MTILTSTLCVFFRGEVGRCRSFALSRCSGVDFFGIALFFVFLSKSFIKIER